MRSASFLKSSGWDSKFRFSTTRGGPSALPYYSNDMFVYHYTSHKGNYLVCNMPTRLTHLTDATVIFKVLSPTTCYGWSSWAFLGILLPPRWMSENTLDDELTLVRIMAWWQAISWADVDPDLYRHMASTDHNEWRSKPLLYIAHVYIFVGSIQSHICLPVAPFTNMV